MCQHEEGLIEAGLVPDEAAALVDELEEYLNVLDEENGVDDQGTIDDERPENVTSTDEV